MIQTPTQRGRKIKRLAVRLSPLGGASSSTAKPANPLTSWLSGRQAWPSQSPMKRHSQAPSSLHEFDLTWAPLFREKCLKWAIEAQKREPALVGHGLNPVAGLYDIRLH